MPEPSRSFAAVLARAIEESGATLSGLRDQLSRAGTPVSLATLSYWRSGQREPERADSLEAITTLERVLGLEPLTLTSLVVPRRLAPAAFDALVGLEGAGIVGERDIRRVLFHLIVDVDQGGRVSTVRSVQVFEAVAREVPAVTIFVGPDADEGMNGTRVRSIAGGTLEATRDVGDGISATRLIFERPLAAGESAVVELEFDEPRDGLPETEYGIVAEQRLEECLVWVRFHPAALPRRTWLGLTENGVDTEWEVQLAGATGLHLRQRDFGPGVCYARWAW